MNKTVKRCPNCRSVPEVYEGLVSCTNDPWCPVGNAMYTLEQWAQIQKDPEAHGRVCTCGLKGNWCHIHNNPSNNELLVAQENAALFKKALETLSKNVEGEALVAEDGWDSGNSPCYVQTFVDIVLSKEKCTECGEIKGTKSGSYCLTCGRING